MHFLICSILRLGLLVLFCGTATHLKSADPLDFADITKPEFFPILPWNYYGYKTPLVKGTNGLESVAQCHFNFAPFVFPKELPLCRELGLGAIVAPADGSTLKDLRGKTYSDAEIKRRVREMIDAAGDNPAVKGYFIMDEPGAKDFPLLARAVETVKKYAPGQFAYINLFPDYATIGAPDTSQLGTSNYTEYLERFVSEVKPQFLSYDNYRVQMSQDLKETARAASYYRNLLEVRRVALKHHLPCLNIVSANQIRAFTTIPSPANLAFQAYTTLAAGYRGVGWYTYYEGGYHYAPISKTGQRSLTWHYLQEINRQVVTLAPVMSRLRSTGVFFTDPAPVAGLPMLPGAVVESLTGSEPMMIGEFTHATGEFYVMVVNLSLERSAKFTLQTRNANERIEIVSAVNGSLSPYDPTAGLWLVAGAGALLRLEK
jgi:hypothetical protein